ncbi:lipocalin family protein [Parabacteroides sp.]
MKQALLLIFTLLLWLPGCSSDDDNKQDTANNLVGTWWLYESYIPASNDTFDYRDQNRLLIFSSDGEYERTGDGSNAEYGTYKQSGNKITLYDTNGKEIPQIEITIRKINSEYLELDWIYVDGSGNKDPWVNRYKRKL